jgi:hypothetical protein
MGTVDQQTAVDMYEMQKMNQKRSVMKNSIRLFFIAMQLAAVSLQAQIVGFGNGVNGILS